MDFSSLLSDIAACAQQSLLPCDENTHCGKFYIGMRVPFVQNVQTVGWGMLCLIKHAGLLVWGLCTCQQDVQLSVKQDEQQDIKLQNVYRDYYMYYVYRYCSMRPVIKYSPVQYQATVNIVAGPWA